MVFARGMARARASTGIRPLEGVRAEEADHLAQEVFLLCWAKLDEFDRDFSIDGKIRPIARGLIANEWHNGSRLSRLMSNLVTSFLLNTADLMEGEPDLGRDYEAELNALEECLSELPKVRRDILQQRYFEELRPGRSSLFLSYRGPMRKPRTTPWLATSARGGRCLAIGSLFLIMLDKAKTYPEDAHSHALFQNPTRLFRLGRYVHRAAGRSER